MDVAESPATKNINIAHPVFLSATSKRPIKINKTVTVVQKILFNKYYNLSVVILPCSLINVTDFKPASFNSIQHSLQGLEVAHEPPLVTLTIHILAPRNDSYLLPIKASS